MQYLHKLLQDFRSKRLVMINKDRHSFQYNSRDLVYVILPLTSLFHPALVRWIPQVETDLSVILFNNSNFDTRNINNSNKAHLQITLINENHSFLSEQLAEDDMKTNDSDNESFLSDQSLCFTLLGSDGSPRLKWIPRLFCFMTAILIPESYFKLLPLICPNIYVDSRNSYC